MIELKRYSSENKKIWNDFLKSSRADTFLFDRNFMDYHADRFNDHSFLIYRKGKLEALIPGNSEGSRYYSHQGLTYGGLLSSRKIASTDVLQIFDSLNTELQKNKITEVIYKPLPIIYQNYPSQEDLYALFRLGAEKIACNISSTIFQNNKIAFIESRKSGIRKAASKKFTVCESDDLQGFWHILESNLLKTHSVKPVHTLHEISQLKANFPSQLKLFCTFHGKEIIGGCLLFLMKNIVHVQYISASPEGKENGALDLLFDTLINQIFKDIPVFDFGQSTEQMGHILNENLIFQKEGFGGRGIVYETYKYTI